MWAITIKPTSSYVLDVLNNLFIKYIWFQFHDRRQRHGV